MAQVGRRGGVLVAAVVCVIGFWAWATGLAGPYHFDDFITPLNDPASQSLSAWERHLSVTLRPFTKLTYALEAEAGWSHDPAPRRLVSLALHAATAAVLFVLTLQLAPSCSPMLATLLASLWFLHPVHADNLLLLSGRSAALSGLLLLGALAALERSRAWWAGLLFLLACLARETALAGLLPLAVLAASRPGTSIRSTVRTLLPSLFGAAWVVAWILATPRYLQLAEYSFLGRPFWQSLAAQVGAVPVGLGLLFNPAALSIDYGVPLPARLTEPMFVFGVLLYLGAVGGIVICWTRSRAAAVGLALWLAALLPTQSLMPKLDALTNRPLSLAFAALLLIAAPGAARLITHWHAAAARTITARSRVRYAVLPWIGTLGGAVGVFVLLAGSTAERSALFGSELALWQDAASKSIRNPRPHLQYAVLLKRSGRDREAVSAVRSAQAIDPFSSQVALFARSYFPTEKTP